MRPSRQKRLAYFTFASAIGVSHVVLAVAQNATSNNQTISNPLNTTLSGSGTLMSDSGYSSVTIENYGTLEELQADRVIIYTSGANAIVSNYGTILSSQNLIAGVEARGNFTTLTNDTVGSISLGGYESAALWISGANSSLVNRGSISVSGNSSDGLHSLGPSNTLINYGTITASGDTSAGMTSYDYQNVSGAGDGAVMTNYGSISITGNISAGLVSTTTSTLINSSTITTTGILTSGIAGGGSSQTLTNDTLGSITTSGAAGTGIISIGTQANVTNNGTITTSGSTYQLTVGTTSTAFGDITLLSTFELGSDGIVNLGTASSIVNSGIINATGNGASGIGNYGGSITSLINSGTISAKNGIVNSNLGNNTASITQFSNLSAGTVSGTSTNDYGIGFYNSASLSTFANSGTIRGISTNSLGMGVNNYTTGSIVDFTNSGTISGTSYGLINSGTISNLTISSTGSISGNTVGIGNSGTITTLTNGQGGDSSTVTNTAITFTGSLPTNYNLLITSSSHYGQVSFSNSSGTLKFGVDDSSQLSLGTYSGILTGIASSQISNNTATGVLGSYSWELIEGSTQYWNLVVARNVAAGTIKNSSDIGVSVKPDIAGGTLFIDQAGTISNNFTLSSATTNTIDANGKSAIISGVISNQSSAVGTVTIADSGGSGAITLTGVNTYTGATSVSSGGTLKLSGSGSIASSSGVALNGTLDISDTNSGATIKSLSGSGTLALGAKTLTLNTASGTFSGLIAGSGSVAVTGGNLTLSGDNTFSGGVRVTAGATVTVGTSLALGTGTLSLIGSVGTSAIIVMKDSVILANNIYVESDPDFTADTGATSTIAGVISGTGDVNIKGLGTVKFSNTNTYSGPTVIDAGSTLALTSTGSISNTSSLTNNGTFDVTAKSGIVSIGGNYTQNSSGTLSIALISASSTTLAISGTATLNGTLYFSKIPVGSHKIITASSVTGTFSSVSVNGLDSGLISVSYATAGEVDLTISASATNTLTALTSSAESERRVLDSRVTAISGTLAYDCSAFDKKRVCASYQARYGGFNEVSEGAGILVGAYKISDTTRIGTFVDYRGFESGSARVSFSNSQPTLGAFIVLSQNKNGLGLQFKMSAAFNRGDVKLERDTSLNGTEAGAGTSRLSSYAFGGEVSYGFAATRDVVLWPYAGLQKVTATRAAYDESSGVSYPISYNSFTEDIIYASSGLRSTVKQNDRLNYLISAGIEQDLYSSADTYSGTSSISGLSSFSMNVGDRRQTRLNASARAIYQLEKNKDFTATVDWRAMPYGSQPAINFLVGYRMAF